MIRGLRPERCRRRRRTKGRSVVVLVDQEPAHRRGSLAHRRRALRPDRWLEGKVSEGGTSLARVREQLDAARRHLG